MNNQLVANEKSIVKRIVGAFNKMENSKRGYVNSVIELGEELINAKNLVPHGQWESWLNDHSEWSFGRTQAQKFMKIASNKTLVLEYFNNENSIDNITKAIIDATPEQIAKANELKAAEDERITREAEEKIKRDAEKAAAKRDAESKKPEIIEGSFTEVKKQEPAKTEPFEIDFLAELQETADVLQQHNTSLSEEIDSLSKIIDSNDQLAESVAENKRLREENRILKERVNGLMNEKNAAVRQVKHWKSLCEKMEKANGTA